MFYPKSIHTLGRQSHGNEPTTCRRSRERGSGRENEISPLSLSCFSALWNNFVCIRKCQCHNHALKKNSLPRFPIICKLSIFISIYFYRKIIFLKYIFYFLKKHLLTHVFLAKSEVWLCPHINHWCVCHYSLILETMASSSIIQNPDTILLTDWLASGLRLCQTATMMASSIWVSSLPYFQL